MFINWVNLVYLGLACISQIAKYSKTGSLSDIPYAVAYLGGVWDL